MATSHQQVIKSRDGDSSTLRIDLINISSTATTALSSRTRYETLEIAGDLTRHNTHSRLTDNFWHFMGETISKLVTHPDIETFRPCTTYTHNWTFEEAISAGVIFDHFVSLERLTIHSSFLRLLSTQFYAQNKKLEEIEIYGVNCYVINITAIDVIDIDVDIDGGIQNGRDVLPGFVNIFKHSTSMKKITFPCMLPYDHATSRDLPAFFDACSFRVEDILFEFDFLTDNMGCYIEKMEIEFLGQRGLSRVAVVKVIDIKACGKKCEGQMDVCIFDHSTFMNQSVQNVNVASYAKHVCLKCFRFMIKSFPNCLRWVNGAPLDSIRVTLLSAALVHLTDLKLSYSGKLELWPVFNQLKCLKINFDGIQSPDGIYHLSQCCQNLEVFKIGFSSSINFKTSAEAFVASITKHLVQLKALEIDSTILVNSRSLQAICVGLKQLTTLTIDYRDDSRNLFELFKELPQLECITYQSMSKKNQLTRQNYLYESCGTKVISRDPIKNLPEEIWILVFKKLNAWNQLNCRLVCKSWWHIFNTYPNFDRRLKIGKCVFALSKNPVKTFLKTQFNYNRLLLQEPIIVCNDDFSEFWHLLERTINEICFGLNFSPNTWNKLGDCGLEIGHFSSCKSYTFYDSGTFFDFISNSRDAITLLKNMKKLTVTCSFIPHNSGVCPDMPNLECVKVIVCSYGDLQTFLDYLIGHCLNVFTLYIVFEYKAKPIEISTDIVIDGVLNIDAMELCIGKWKGLRMLFIHCSDCDFKTINTREVAIRFFKLFPDLINLSLSDSTKTIRFNLECSNDFTKKVVEINDGCDDIVVYTERKVVDMR